MVKIHINKGKINGLEFLFHTIILFFILHIIKAGETECPRDRPILKSGNCVLDNCTDSSECIVANPIIKTQWLNNIRKIGDSTYRYINFGSFSNGDMIIETTCYPKLAKRMFYEPDISEEIVINSDMTISDKLFYENGNVAVDITCDFNNAGRCLGYSELGSYDDTSRSNYEDGIAYTEYFDAVYPEQLAESSNPLYGKNIKATSYYQNGKVAFEFEQNFCFLLG